MRNETSLLLQRRRKRVSLSSGPELPVVLCTWRRREGLERALDDLAQQDVPVQAVIWNNGLDRDIVDEISRAASLPVTVHHSRHNIGGFGRFVAARELAASHERVIFVDDDHRIGPTTVRDLTSRYRAQTISGWWAFRFSRAAFSDLARVDDGEPASYVGTCGMIADISIFRDDALFNCPRRFWFVEDLWLSYVASHLRKWGLFGSHADLECVNDGRDQWLSLGETKTRFVRYLIRQGWTEPSRDVRAMHNARATADGDHGLAAVPNRRPT
jgi:hypothetical protein